MNNSKGYVLEICQSKSAGYNVRLIDKSSERYHCPLCQLVLRNPIQTPRGELACETCYRDATRNEGVCPLDNEPIEYSDIYLDKCRRREIIVLSCHCSNEQYGCPWKGTVGEFEEHESRCVYQPVQCCLCSADISQNDVLPHLKCCEKFLLDKKCIYKQCPYKVTTFEDFETHLHNNIIYHAVMATSHVDNIQTEVNDKLQVQHEEQKKRENIMSEKINTLKEQFKILTENDTVSKLDVANSLKCMEEKISIIERSTSTRMSTRSCSNSHMGHQNVLSDQIKGLSDNISQLNLRLSLFENTSTDGRILWKIDNVSSRLNQAVTGKVTALHSAPVFTERYGYKFCGRLYLNGDGVGRGTHASLFFVLMKSEYDNLLSWPFNKFVSMRLINQKDQNSDLEEGFLADVNSSSFQQPKKEMNIASGCPMFVTKEKLLNGGFIKDDTMFIELKIKT